MKFTCEKNALVSAISVASRTVAQKSTIPALEGIYIRAGVKLTLSGYNLETGITISVDADIQETGACIMPSRLFFDIIRKLPDDTVSISVDENFKVSIRGGISSFSITAMSSEDYPELPEVDSEKGIDLPQSELKAMIGGTSFAVSENQARPIHTGCLFEVTESDITVIAVDGYRLALRRWIPEGGERKTMKFVVPAAALKEAVLGLLLHEHLGVKVVLFRDVCLFSPLRELRLITLRFLFGGRRRRMLVLPHWGEAPAANLQFEPRYSRPKLRYALTHSVITQGDEAQLRSRLGAGALAHGRGVLLHSLHRANYLLGRHAARKLAERRIVIAAGDKAARALGGDVRHKRIAQQTGQLCQERGRVLAVHPHGAEVTQRLVCIMVKYAAHKLRRAPVAGKPHRAVNSFNVYRRAGRALV